MPEAGGRSGDRALSEVARICINPDCVYAEFGFQAGSEVNLFSDPKQHAHLCALAPQVSFSNAFLTRADPFTPSNFTVDIYSTGQVYGSAAASLAADQGGAPITHTEVSIVNGVPTNTINHGVVPNPFIFTSDGEVSRLLVYDTDGVRTNNTGGISLSVEVVRAGVPEPNT